MKNPWIRKNPWISLWLSGANSVANRARMQATAETRRQATTAIGDGARRVTDFWTAVLTPPAAARPAKRRRKSR